MRTTTRTTVRRGTMAATGRDRGGEEETTAPPGDGADGAVRAGAPVEM